MDGRTCLKSLEPGRPLSRVNAQACLEAEATNPNVAKMYMAMRKDVIAVAPGFGFVAL